MTLTLQVTMRVREEHHLIALVADLRLLHL